MPMPISTRTTAVFNLRIGKPTIPAGGGSKDPAFASQWESVWVRGGNERHS